MVKKYNFEIEKNKNNVDITTCKYNGDKLNDSMKLIPSPLPKKNFSMYIVGRPASGKSTLLNSLLCNDGRKLKCGGHKSRFYYKVYDMIFIFSASLATCDNPPKIPENRIFDTFDGELLNEILDLIKEGDNKNCLFVFDDVISSIGKNTNENVNVLHKMLLNRRHITHNEFDDNEEHLSGCSSIICSQRYNLLPLYIRSSGISHLILFKVSNLKDLQDIHIETSSEMDFKLFKKLTDFAWNEPHNFLYIILDAPIEDKFYKNFDKILLTEKDLE